MMRTHRYWALALAVFAIVATSRSPISAGTTGGISGHVIDSASAAPIDAAKVTSVSPSQSETAVTDANGAYSFV